MKFSILVAKKFLLRDKKSAPSKITGWIAVVGLAVGCLAMVLSLSVLNGFENRIINFKEVFPPPCKTSSESLPRSLAE